MSWLRLDFQDAESCAYSDLQTILFARNCIGTFAKKLNVGSCLKLAGNKGTACSIRCTDEIANPKAFDS